MKRILVTGAGGFIGKNLCKRLFEEGCDFLALTFEKNTLPYPSEMVFLEDAESLESIVADYQPDCVVHLAALANVAYKGDAADIYRTNVCGTENLLEAIRSSGAKESRLILTSTAGVYGNQDVEFYHESLPFNPTNHYSFSKMVTEYLSRLYTKDFDIAIIRPFNVTGSGQTTGFLVPKLVQHFVEKRSVLRLGNIDSYRDFVDINFMIEVLMRLIQSASTPDVLNICSGNAYSCRDILGILTEITAYTPEIEIGSDIVRRNEVWRLVGDTRRLSMFLGNELKPVSIEKILERMVNEYQAIQ
jgi:nucleoside-diphosphate-sugar epimerase